MDSILNYINNMQVYIIAVLVVVVGILVITVIVLLKSISNIEKKYRKLTRGVNNKNLENIIIDYMDKVDEAKKSSDEVRELFTGIDDRIDGCIQKVAILRYKAFEDVGSDLSYSIALLDKKDDGVVVTGIFGRNESTTYAKPIEKGISRYELSDEEKEVLADAINK